CKLDYYGATFDNDNATATSPMDRMVSYQYLYNIVMYRIELLMASDKGKKLLMNVAAILKSSGIDIEKWMYYADALGIIFFDPTEEGQQIQSASSVAGSIDQSLASKIAEYIQIAE